MHANSGRVPYSHSKPTRGQGAPSCGTSTGHDGFVLASPIGEPLAAPELLPEPPAPPETPLPEPEPPALEPLLAPEPLLALEPPLAPEPLPLEPAVTEPLPRLPPEPLPDPERSLDEPLPPDAAPLDPLDGPLPVPEPVPLDPLDPPAPLVELPEASVPLPVDAEPPASKVSGSVPPPHAPAMTEAVSSTIDLAARLDLIRDPSTNDLYFARVDGNRLPLLLCPHIGPSELIAPADLEQLQQG